MEGSRGVGMSKKALQTARAEAGKLHAEADKLTAEGDLIWINAWIKVHGKESIVDWNWGK